MAKSRRVFRCQQCGYESARWVGRCPACLEWNSIAEEAAFAPSSSGWKDPNPANEPQGLRDISARSLFRYPTGSAEIDRVLGGGLVPGSLILLGGDPGIGKSTLLLQAAGRLAEKEGPVLYVSAEESIQQIALRANRLGLDSRQLLVMGEADLDSVAKQVQTLRPKMLIIDSIQTVFRPELAMSPGSIGQVREGTAFLMKLAKSFQLATWIAGHVTKDGAIAGPRVLEHIVDVVLYLEGEGQHPFRVLRAVKNRFGSTNECGLLEMRENGLVDVENPSEWLLAERPAGNAGSVVVAALEGTRPLLVEIQALVVQSGFGHPRRSITGADFNRVSLILAVLEKRVGLKILEQDVFVNVVGGVKVPEPAIDLGIAVALASSFKGRPVGADYLVAGEIGLTGELRAVTQIERRIREASRVGFRHFVVPRGNERHLGKLPDAELIGAATLAEALQAVLI